MLHTVSHHAWFYLGQMALPRAMTFPDGAERLKSQLNLTAIVSGAFCNDSSDLVIEIAFMYSKPAQI